LGDRPSLIILLSNARDVTADFFECRLKSRGCSFVRLDSDVFASANLTIQASAEGWGGTFELNGSCIDVQSIGAIYYRRPQPPILSEGIAAGLRDWMSSELRCAWGGLLSANRNVRWVNHPLAASAASYKPEQLARAPRFGLRVPETLITTDPSAARAFCRRLRWRIIAKPIGHGEILGEDGAVAGLVYTNAVDASHDGLLDRVAACPTLLQRQIDKQVDIRVCVVDSECIALALHSQENPSSAIDCRRDNMRGMRYSPIELPSSLKQSLVALTASYDLHYSAIDLALDTDGTYWYLESNPAGQWAWLEQLTGVAISDAIIRCLIRA
jgi:hypothetical protein